MLVGRYYLNEHNYAAAINRFREVLFKYQTTRHAEEALERLTEAYLALGIPSEAQTAAAVLGHNFPELSWYKDAYALLQGGGLQPHEDKGSWISKAFLHKMASARLRQSARRVRYEVSDSAVSAVAVIFYDGKVLFGIIIVLQLTVIGWLPATIWAFFAISDYHADQRADKIVRASRSRINDDRT